MDSMFSVLRYIFTIAFLIIIGAYASVWVFSPWLANHYLDQYLDTHGLSLDGNTRIRYNPFRSRLEINSLQINNDKAEKVSALSFFSLELDLHQLVFEEVYIPRIVIKGLDFDIKKLQDDLLVGGISLAILNKGNQPATQKDSSESNGLSFLNRFIMSKLVLEESNIYFYNDKARHQLKLHTVNIIDLFATSRNQTVGLSISGELDNAPIDISMTADLINQEGGIDFDVNISNVEVEKFIDFLPKDIDSLLGVLSYKGKHRLNIAEGSFVLNIEKGHFSGMDVNFIQDDIHVSIEQQEISINDFSVILEKNKKSKLAGASSILVQNIIIYNKEKSMILAAIKQLELSSIIAYNDEQGTQKVHIGNVDFVDSFFSDNQNDDVPALVRFTLLNIQEVGLSSLGIELGDISLAGLVANAELDENKQVKNLLIVTGQESRAALAEATVDEDDNITPETLHVVEKEATADKSPFTIKLKSFSLADVAEILFIDQSVYPIYRQNIAITKLSAGPFDTEIPNQESIVSIAGNSDRYAAFSLLTKAKPFLKEPTYKIDGTLQEFSLPSLSSYIKQPLKFEIESGQLDLDIDMQLTGTKVDGEVQVMLRGIDLIAVDDFEISSLNGPISVPLNLALGMLKDSDGNVELSLPITGDTRSPNFGFSGFLTLIVKKATLLGARDYLVTTFIPYAQVVNVVALAGSYALKVRVNDLTYLPEKIYLQTEQQEFLKQLSALLRVRASTQVKLCAIATAKDIGKESGSDLTSTEDKERLIEISKQRVSVLKAYMIEEQKIPSSRLLLCTPQIDSSMDAVSRLSFKT
ncbi:MAG: hypothetical protein ACI9ES_002608 [Oceanospirillaceae bacterium]|jgi:hypothetical protein